MVIEQRIKAAERHLNYMEYVEDGKQAVTEGNYALALEFFKKARSIDDTLKIREWITHAEKKLRGDFQFTPVRGGGAPVVLKKKKSGLRPLLWVLAIAGVVVIGIVVVAVVSSMNDLGRAARTLDSGTDYEVPVYDYSNDTKRVQEDPVKTTAPAMTSVSPLVPGTWNVNDRYLAGYSMAAAGTLAPASWVFYNNGTLAYWENGVSVYGTWTLTEGTGSFTSTISIPDIGVTGYISEIDQNKMTILTSELLGQVTNYLVRID